MDPTFHTDLMLNDTDYEYIKQLIIQKMKNIDFVNPYISQQLTTMTKVSLSTSRTSRVFSLKKYLNSTDIRASTSLSAQPLTIDSEIFTYVNLVRQNEELDFQSFWKTHFISLPRLSQIARIYNVVPATSTYLEQTFSVAGAIKNIRRASLSTLSLRSLIMLKKKNDLEKLRSFIDQ